MKHVLDKREHRNTKFRKQLFLFRLYFWIHLNVHLLKIVYKIKYIVKELNIQWKF